MQPQPWRNRIVVNDEKTAQLLSRGGETLRYLAPFLGREASVKTAAQETGMKLNVMAYWVRRFALAGVLIETRVQPRRGSAIRFYRAIADEILVPTSLIDSDSERELLQRLHETDYDEFSFHVARTRRFLASDWDLRYFRHGDRQGWNVRPREEIGPQELRRHYLHEWFYLALDAQKASELRHELAALLEKYQAYATPTQERKQFMLHLGFVQR